MQSHDYWEAKIQEREYFGNGKMFSLVTFVLFIIFSLDITECLFCPNVIIG